MGKYDNLVSQIYKQGLEPDQVKSKYYNKILYMDDTTHKGAPYVEVVWYFQRYDLGKNSHVHSWDEFLGFMGTDPEDPMNLHARIRMEIEDEVLYIDKSSLIWIPAGLHHSIFAIEEIDRPILHFSGGPNAVYEKTGNTLGDRWWIPKEDR